MKLKSIMIVLLLLTMAPVAMASDTDSHVHIAAFFKVPGQQAFQWPEEINGEDIIGALRGKADFLILIQSAGIHNGDMLNLQNDVLRAGGKAVEDMGIDCQLSVDTSGKVWKVGGKCVIDLPHIGNKKIIGTINPHSIPSEKVWHHVWDDPESGVAVYFFKETGAVLEH